jgi:hypothetical protein
VKIHGSQLLHSTDKITGRSCCKLQAVGRNSANGSATRLRDEPSAFPTTLASPPRLLPEVGFALRPAPPRARYSSHHRISRIKLRATSAVTARASTDEWHRGLGYLGKQHGRPCAHEQVCRKAHRGVARYTRKRVTAATLYANDEFRGRVLNAPTLAKRPRFVAAQCYRPRELSGHYSFSLPWAANAQAAVSRSQGLQLLASQPHLRAY